jgi:hypothetical protein
VSAEVDEGRRSVCCLGSMGEDGLADVAVDREGMDECEKILSLDCNFSLFLEPGMEDGRWGILDGAD